MNFTVARLVHRVPDGLRSMGWPSLALAPSLLAAAQPTMRSTSPSDAAWKLIDPEGAIRQSLVPVPIALAKVRSDHGRLLIMLAIDAESQLCLAWREGTGAKLVRPTDGGLTDIVRQELDALLDRSPGLRNEGPTAESLDVLLAIRDGAVPEIVHREVPPFAPGQIHPDHALPHPWFDDVFAAVAAWAGAEQTKLLRPARIPRRPDEWKWMGPDPRGDDGMPLEGWVSGLPEKMPPFVLRRRNDRDHLLIHMGSVTYDRVGPERKLKLRREKIPETVWTRIGSGTPLSALCDMPGLGRYVVDTVEEAGELAIISMKERT